MPSLDALGQLEATGDRWRLRFTRHLPHPIEKVWQAVTEPEHLAAWFPTTIDGDRATGADLTFRFGEEDAPEMKGTMLAWDPPRRLEIQWGDDDRVRIELTPDDAGTVLTLTDVFGEMGRATRDAAGWHGCLDALADHLAGRPVPAAGRWAELAPVYREHLGPEASTVGPPDWHPES